MVIIPTNIIVWSDLNELEIGKITTCTDYIPDEEFMQKLEYERKRTNDYPVRAMWNSILAGAVFEIHQLRV